MQEQADGTDNQEQADGTDNQEQADRTDNQEQADGTGNQEQADGTDNQEQADGTDNQEQANGTDNQEQADGTDNQEQADGTDNQEQDDGRDTQEQTDRKESQKHGDGIHNHGQADGRDNWEQGDKAENHEQADERDIHKQADGRETQEQTNRRDGEKHGDRTDNHRQDHGNNKWEQEDETVNQEQTDGRDTYEDADRRDSEKQCDGKDSQEQDDARDNQKQTDRRQSKKQGDGTYCQGQAHERDNWEQEDGASSQKQDEGNSKKGVETYNQDQADEREKWEQEDGMVNQEDAAQADVISNLSRGKKRQMYSSSDDDSSDDSGDEEYVPESECSDFDEDETHLAMITRKIVQSSQISSSSGPSQSSSGIKVLQTSNGKKRKWDKMAYCPFCETRQSKLPRHLAEFKAHQDELEVIQWKATQDPELKAKRLTKLRNLGNFLHNSKVRKENRGYLIPVYRPNYEANPSDYVPCPDCLGEYAKRDLWKHSCQLRCDDAIPKGKKKHRQIVKEGIMLLPIPGISNQTKEILSSIRNDGDGVGAFIKTDDLTKKLAEKLSLRLGHDRDQFSHIRTKLREISRMVIEYRKDTGHTDAALKDLIDPEKFNLVVRATRRTSGYDEKTHLYKTPSLALKIGHTLKKAAEILLGEALETSDAGLKAKSKEFIKLYNMTWEERVSSHALRTLKENKRNNPKYLPLTEDIVKLTQHLKQKVADGSKLLQDFSDPHGIGQVWKDLAMALLASLTVFNRKRSGEVAKMTASDLSNCTSGNKGLMTEGLSKLEETLCKVLWRTEIIGKRARTVPLLMTNDWKTSLELLEQKKADAGVPEGNPYVFALFNNDGHMRGSDAIREFANGCGAQHPDYLTSTSLRKHIATVCQIMNLKDNELDVLARFLGHDIRTHREYYRLPEQTLQLAKVSKVLFHMESGNIKDLAGKNLDDVDLDPNEEVPQEEDKDELGESDVSASPPHDEPPINIGTLSGSISSSVNDTTNDTVAKPSNKPRKCNKQTWTNDQKRAVLRNFKSCFHRNVLPGKLEIQKVIQSEPVLQSRNWTKVKDFIRNQLRKDDPLDFM